MGFGIGIVFVVVGLIILTGAVTIPDAVTKYADAHLIGVILLVLGIVAILLGLMQARSRSGPPEV